MSKTIPQSIEAEMAVLGSILTDPDMVYKIIDFIGVDDYYATPHRSIFSSMISLLDSGSKIDIVTLSDELDKRGELKNVGGRSYLAKLYGASPIASNIIEYARVVEDKSLRRQLLIAQDKNTKKVYDENAKIDQVIAEVQGNIFSVNPAQRHGDDIHSILRSVESTQKLYEEKYQNGIQLLGHSTGIASIDESTDGLVDGSFWVVGGWSGVGKTSFCLNMVNSFMNAGVKCSIVTLEMSRELITAKLIGVRHKLSAMKVLKGIYTVEQKKEIDESKEFLKKSQLIVHSEFDIEKIKMLIRKDVYANGVKVVLVDYLQKISSESIYDETPLVSKATKDLANLAQELNVSIICISQISNEAQRGKGAGAGFKGSGTIEASADLAIVLRRDKNSEEPNEEVVPVSIHITKNKYGFDGVIDYYMDLKSGAYQANIYGI